MKPLITLCLAAVCFFLWGPAAFGEGRPDVEKMIREKRRMMQKKTKD